ncbi:MAG: four helix bundle protein [Bacteroidetes bacterium]|nr:four helix bundle protein [Bacteroidota bacterium]
MRNFKKLKNWQMGMELVNRIYEMTEQLPQEEKSHDL